MEGVQDIHPWHGLDCQTCREQVQLTKELMIEILLEERERKEKETCA